MKNLILFFISLLFISCSSHNNELFYKNSQPATVSNQQLSLTPEISSDYYIAPHDRLSIVFYKYPELSTTTKDGAKDDFGLEVAEDGTINLPIIKRIKVAGYSKNELERVLSDKYSPYLQDPSVKVEVLNKRVYVTGEVKNPGSLEYVKYKSITPVKAIIQRGGLTKYANPKGVKVLRDVGGSYKLYNLDLTNMQSMRVANLKLQPDDIVYVPHNSATGFNLPLNGIEPSLSIVNTILNSIVMYKSVTD